METAANNIGVSISGGQIVPSTPVLSQPEYGFDKELVILLATSRADRRPWQHIGNIVPDHFNLIHKTLSGKIVCKYILTFSISRKPDAAPRFRRNECVQDSLCA